MSSYKRGEWVVFKQADEEYRTGQVGSDENGCGVIVEDHDTGASYMVPRDCVRFEDDETRSLRVELGYYAQDLSPLRYSHAS